MGDVDRDDREAETPLMGFADFLELLWRNKLLILAGPILGGLLAFGFALLQPTTYLAKATAYPISTGPSTSAIAGLASLAGFSLGDTASTGSANSQINAIMKSRLFLETTVERLSLIPSILPKASTTSDPESQRSTAAGVLAKALSFDRDKDTGVMIFSVELEDPVLAQMVANGVIETLDNMLVDKGRKTNQRRAELLGDQIRSQGERVSSLQGEIARFQQSQTMLDPERQSSQAFQTYMSLVQQKLDLQLKIANAQTTYSPGNPKLVQLQNQMENLEAQIQSVKTEVDGDLPSLKLAPENLIRFKNLTRDFEISAKIYSALLASLEQLRLADDPNQANVEVLDPAELPKKPKQNHLQLVLLGVFAGLGLAVIGIFGWNRFTVLLAGRFGRIT